MNEAKDCIRRVINLAARIAWEFASALPRLGCSTFGGLQSVGTWPPFAHLWERRPGSPSPENDTYAQAMRAHLGLDTKLGRREEAAAGSRRATAAEADAADADSEPLAIASGG